MAFAATFGSSGRAWPLLSNLISFLPHLFCIDITPRFSGRDNQGLIVKVANDTDALVAMHVSDVVLELGPELSVCDIVMWTIQYPAAFTYKKKPDDENYAFNGLIDIYVPEAQENYQKWEKYFFEDYDIEPAREKLWIYVTHTTRVAIDTIGINNRAFALDVFNAGGSGYLCWASFMWDKAGSGNETDNPWEHPWTRWANGAMSYFYPPSRAGVSPRPDWRIVPSLRVMTYREGVDDYEYAYILEQLVAKAEAKGVNTLPAKAVLKDIKRFFYSSVHWSQNDAWYLDLRDRMARAIVNLKKDITKK